MDYSSGPYIESFDVVINVYSSHLEIFQKEISQQLVYTPNGIFGEESNSEGFDYEFCVYTFHKLQILLKLHSY